MIYRYQLCLYPKPGWLAFLADGGSVGPDLNPGPVGTPGQVINFGRDEREKYVLADSLDGFVREYLKRLNTGRVTVRALDEVDGEMWAVELHDDAGQVQEGYFALAELFPGFGAVPGIRP